MPAAGHASPGPPGLPLVGHLPAFARRRHELLAACARLPGAVLELEVAGRTLLVRDPGDVHHVLVGAGDRYEKSHRAVGPASRTALGMNVFTAAGAEHRPRRRRAQPAFRHDRVAQLTGILEANAERMLARWRDAEEADVMAEATALARRNMAMTVFGVSDPAEVATIEDGVELRRRAGDRALKGATRRPARAPVAVRPRGRRGLRAFDRLLDRLVAERRAGNGGGILGWLTDSHPADDRAVRTEAIGIAAAASETVARAIAWGWLELARSPAVADRVRAGEPGYARAVACEVLRLHPPTPVIARVAVAPDVLPSGVGVREGTKVMVSPFLTHRDPQLWPEPERFLPDRFARGEPSGRARYAYYPFGGGPRVCLGQSLATLEIERTLALTAERYDLEPGAPGRPARGMAEGPPPGSRVQVTERPS